jgi:hypothetical protein
VPASLEELQGPTEGSVKLPVWIQWSGRTTYDLARVEDVVWMYSRVIREACSEGDLRAYLSGEHLVALWPQLTLPARHVRAWEGAFDRLRGLEG